MTGKKTISVIPLTKLKKRCRAKVLEITACSQTKRRLSGLGIRPGTYFTKISAFALRGPVTVKVGRATVALGHGMAEKVIVEPAHHH